MLPTSKDTNKNGQTVNTAQSLPHSSVPGRPGELPELRERDRAVNAGKHGPDASLSARRGGYPGSLLPRRIVPNMLWMATLEVRDPIPALVLMKAIDTAVYGWTTRESHGALQLIVRRQSVASFNSRRQPQLLSGSRRHVGGPATQIAMNAVDACKENGRAKNDLAGVEEGVFLELLIPGPGLAMTFGGIDDAPTCNALGLGRKAEDPTKADDCGNHDECPHETHPSQLLTVR